jgi:hypothetical protein
MSEIKTRTGAVVEYGVGLEERRSMELLENYYHRLEEQDCEILEDVEYLA